MLCYPWGYTRFYNSKFRRLANQIHGRSRVMLESNLYKEYWRLVPTFNILRITVQDGAPSMDDAIVRKKFLEVIVNPESYKCTE